MRPCNCATRAGSPGRMSHLRELQLSFSEYLFAPERAVSIVDAVVGDEKGSAEDRLALYGDSYELRLVEVLGVDFPGVHSLLGDRAFTDMCRAYIAAHPSQHPSIRWFGRKMTEFLQVTPPYSEHEVLLEMAEFEWAKNQVFDAANSEVVTLNELAAIAPERWGEMCFEFGPALCRLQFHNNVLVLWDAIDREVDALPELQRSEVPVQWLVWRKGLDPHWRSLDIDESRALDYCLQGMNFADLCEHLCEWVDEEHAPMRAVTFLKNWVDGQMVSKIRLGANA